MSDAYETLELEEPFPGLLVVRLARPHVRNALNTQMGEDLLHVFGGIYADPAAYRCVVITGEGDKAFCAGGDLKERNGMTDAQWREQHHLFERKVLSIVDCPIPVMAAINGVAYAGGLEMVLACDFAYAVNTARFALTETKIGIMPGGGGTQTLPRAVGLRRAKEVIWTAQPFSAQEALQWGIVNKLCEPGKLMDEVLSTCRLICDNAPLSIRQSKRSMQYGSRMDLRTALFYEIDAYNQLIPTEDRHEGVLAFNEKRKPVFHGK